MKVAKADYLENPNVGFFSFATENVLLVGYDANKNFLKTIGETLGLKPMRVSVFGMNTISFFIAGNSRGIILHKNAGRRVVEKIKKSVDVMLLDTKYNALGNLILANDNGCVVSYKLRKYMGEIKDFLGVKKISTSTISKFHLVGSLGYCTNMGCLVHRRARKEEVEKIKEVLNVNVFRGSLNMGNPWISSSIIANSRGMVLGQKTLPRELGIAYKAFSGGEE